LPPDTTTLRAAALERAPLVVQTAAQERAAAAAATISRSSYWPTLSAAYSTSSQGLTQPWNGFDTNRNLNQLRIGLSWTLFNGFQREQTVAQNAATLDFAKAQAADARRQIYAQLTQQIAATFTAWAQIAIAGADVAAATEAARVQQERYRLGAGTLLDLLTAQANLTQAAVSQVQARYNYLIARAQLEAIVGHAL
jgi:outer membrane protein TolC